MRVTIERIGSAGDGAAILPDGTPIHIPRTLPGETVRATLTHPTRKTTIATLEEIETPSPDRIYAPCPHFPICGGCALQHWQDGSYAAWKAAQPRAALIRAGFTDPPMAPLQRTPPRSRRRIDLAARRIEGGILLGLHRTGSHDIADIHTCLVMHPAIFALLAPLRTLLGGLGALRRDASILIDLSAAGPDLLLRTDGPLTQTDRSKIAAFAQAASAARVSWAQGETPPETAALLANPHLVFAGHSVDLPPGAFLQASAEGEEAIVAAVLDGLPKTLTQKSRAVELFAGIGTISFPLAQKLRVIAYEGDAQAAAALKRAQSGTRVESVHRDLARQPLSIKELKGAACIVLDPPYPGAAAQMPAIAQSRVPRVIYVSCNPIALARDAATLAASGYKLLSATPIDQFLWSAHVETVAVFG